MVHLLSGNLSILSDLVLGIVVRWHIDIYAIGLLCLHSPCTRAVQYMLSTGCVPMGTQPVLSMYCTALVQGLCRHSSPMAYISICHRTTMPSTRSLKILRLPESRWTIIIVAMPLLSSSISSVVLHAVCGPVCWCVALV